MTRTQALKLKDDIGNTIEESDYCDRVYLSIKGIGTKSFIDCSLHEAEGWIFIWTRTESFAFKRKEVGDLLLIHNPNDTTITLRN